MIILEITEEETQKQIETFFNEISRTVNDYNHPYKFKDDKEVCTIINYLFKLSGSKLRLYQFTSHGEPGFVLKPVDEKLFKSNMEAYVYYLQFNNDVMKLSNVLKAFKKVYRFKEKYKHLWSGDVDEPHIDD